MELELDEKTKKIGAIFMTFVLIATFIWAVSQMSIGVSTWETGEATIEDLLNTQSTMSEIGADAVVVSDDSPFYALMATPVALHYSNGEGANASEVFPLLVVNSDEPSSAITQFVSLYKQNFGGDLSAVTIGDIGDTGSIQISEKENFFANSVEETSIALAQRYWIQTDGVILIKDCQQGYNFSISIAPLASYLSIPIIITDKVDADLADVLEGLDVEYSLVGGEMSGYRKTLHFDGMTVHTEDVMHDRERLGSHELAEDITITIIEERLESPVKYITLANPLDVWEFDVVDSKTFEFAGEIGDSGSAAYPGAAPSSPDGPTHAFEVPEDYLFMNVKIDLKMDVTEAGTRPWWGNTLLTDPRNRIEDNADGSGERIYIYLGRDLNEDDSLDASDTGGELIFFGGSPAYDFIRQNPDDPTSEPIEAYFHTELPLFNETTNKFVFSLLARLPTDSDYQAPYDVNITVERISSPIYPLMKGLSSMAPYLTAYRLGVAMVKPEYQLHDVGYIGCESCGEPAPNIEVHDEANEQAVFVKEDLNKLLGKLAGKDVTSKEDWEDLATFYRDLPYDQRPHIGIIADPNMVPQFYFVTTGQGGATEGYGIPSDNIYMDIDLDPEDAPYDMGGRDPDFELPIGRFASWDAQDVSALIVRTFFYYDIIDHFQGPMNDGVNMNENWKDSAMTSLGSVPPIASAIPTTTKLNLAFDRAGFQVDKREHKYQNARRQYAADYYMSSNFHFFCAHGFYYWYVPTAWEGELGLTVKTGGGGAFDVTHVKDMKFGPGIIFGDSCVTGRTDGLYVQNALSMAFLHAGLNIYIGATRSSWGSLVPMPDAQSGEIFGGHLALMFYANLIGYIYDKQGGTVQGNDLEDLSVGLALMDAKTQYVVEHGTDNGGAHDDTYNEFTLHGDPAFNPYEPMHEGGV